MTIRVRKMTSFFEISLQDFLKSGYKIDRCSGTMPNKSVFLKHRNGKRLELASLDVCGVPRIEVVVNGKVKDVTYF